MDELRPPRSASAELIYHTLIRPWHLGATVAASALLLIASGVLAIAARMLLDTTPGTASIADAAQPAPAPVVIVLNQAPPDSAANTAAALPSGPTVQNPVTVDGMPVVRADQVTAPGQAPPSAAQIAPVASAGQTSIGQTSIGQTSQRTYAQMFQEIALQYDLDWRLLAAQAYQESGFDPLALGNDGDMGLMQVLPSTWREWAPKVGAQDPFDAYNNTLVAAAYLDHVRGLMGQRGKPQAQWMLVAYNWGPDKLGTFLDEGRVWDDLPPERARYATDIMSIARTIP
jgi:soluble lytic murein transglycosylase-like protein